MRLVTRRATLHLAGVGISATLGGCLGDDEQEDDNPPPTVTPEETPTETPPETPELVIVPDELPGAIRPDADPATVPEPLVCKDDAFERHSVGFDESELEWGSVRDNRVPTFALRVDDLAFERGDEIRVTLTNVRGVEMSTGNRYKYNFQVYTGEGWQDVRGWAGGMALPYTDELVEHEPGTGFEWTLTLTEEGLLDGHPHEDDLVVCPGLPAGRYRFAFWGVDGAVAAAFDLVD